MEAFRHAASIVIILPDAESEAYFVELVDATGQLLLTVMHPMWTRFVDIQAQGAAIGRQITKILAERPRPAT